MENIGLYRTVDNDGAKVVLYYYADFNAEESYVESKRIDPVTCEVLASSTMTYTWTESE